MTENLDTSNTALKANTLTITPPIRLVNDINVHPVSKTTEQVKHRNMYLVTRTPERVK